MLFSAEEQLLRTKEILDLLNSWNISAKDQVVLLGLPATIKARHLQRYEKNESLPQIDNVNECIDHLFGIGDALRTSYPHTELMGALWLRTSHRRFENVSPLFVMLNQGLSGLIIIRSHLDCAFDWQLDHKNNK